jgi:class 3 adenylate cyclase
MSNSLPASEASIYQLSEKQNAEIAQLNWAKTIEILPVLEQHRHEFVSVMVKQNFQRMVTASKFGAIVIAVLILLMDVLNLPGIPPETASQAMYAHLTLFAALVVGYYAGRRLKLDDPNASIRMFFLWASVFRSLYSVLAYCMLYFMTKTSFTIAGPFAVFVGLISSGLYANRSYILGIAAFNVLCYAVLVVATATTRQSMIQDLFTGTATVAIAAFSSSVLYQSFRQEFAMTKGMEEERQRALALNAQLGEANEEISQQIDVLNEQAREIELTNATLQEKSLELETERNNLERLYQELNIERDKSEELLQNILPRSIADRLKSGEENIANHFESVTVLFADIVGFTQLSASKPAAEVVTMLNRIFSAFDIFSEQYHLEKIKTIGDAYMIVGGLPEPRSDHAEAVARMALEMLATVEFLSKTTNTPLSLRIGIHTGAAVAGVIGKKKFAYDLWGDTVNTASRMESHGQAGKIHVSQDVYNALKEKFVLEERGEIEIKGKGMMQTWFLARAREQV